LGSRGPALIRRDSARCALGAGGWVTFQPPHPRWLDKPGFFDGAHVFNAELAPVHALSFLEVPEGEPLDFRLSESLWTPEYWERRFRAEDGSGRAILLAERGTLLPGGRIRSELELSAETVLPPLVCVAWTWLPEKSRERDANGGVLDLGDGLAVVRRIRSHRFPEVRVRQVLRGRAFRPLPPRWVEGGPGNPDWRSTPWWDEPLGHPPPPGPEDLPSRAACMLAIRRRFRAGGRRWRFHVETRLEILARKPVRPFSVLKESGFRVFRGDFPVLETEREDVAACFEHRIQVLHLQRIPGGLGRIAEPVVCEGPGFFREPIAYSAPAAMRDLRWSRDPSLARGLCRSFLRARETRGPDRGRIPGRLYLESLEGADFYFADWAGGVEALDLLHPSAAYLRSVEPGLEDHARWILKRRTSRSGLVVVRSHFETGQEFNPRYTAVDPRADREEWEGGSLRLEAVDASVYLFRLLDRLERRTGRTVWARRRRALGKAIRGLFDPGEGFYFDRDPRTSRSVRVRAATGFYPLLSDLPGLFEVESLCRALEDPGDFGTPFPVPSLSRRDPAFDPGGRWKGVRRVCPWNGRVWPMLNSHLLEAFQRTSNRGDLDPAARRRAAVLAAGILESSLGLLTGKGDGGRLQSFEHYDPSSGRPSRYRGIDDYLHAWMLDNLLTGFCGLVPEAAGLRLAPLPAPGDFRLRLKLRGRDLRLERRGRRLTLDLGRTRLRSLELSPDREVPDPLVPWRALR